MINREIPFRPRLEGDFRVRFYDAASSITEHTPLSKIEHIIEAEINWVTNECTFNLEQRKKYRAVWYLFRDLIHANWKAFYRDGVLYMSLPSLNGASLQDGSAPEVKQLLRSWMSESRHERLLTFTEFIKHMETVNSNGHSIGDLIADGEELANRIEQAKEGKIALNEAVKPYLQLVSENEKDILLDFSGLTPSQSSVARASEISYTQMHKPADRLRQNRELIIAIGQLSEDSRKKLSRSLSRTKGDDKERLQKAYRILQNFYKYAKKTTLKELSFDTVKELFSASQKKDTPPKPPQPENPDDPIEPVEPEPTAPIRPKELDGLISDAIVSGDADDMGYTKQQPKGKDTVFCLCGQSWQTIYSVESIKSQSNYRNRT